MYLNKVFLYGNLTRDPELKALPSGSNVVNFSIATNRVYKDKSGVQQETVEFHNIVAFGRQAEVIAQYVKKGRPLFVEGRLQTRSWDGQDGKKNYKTEIVLESFQFGASSGGGGGSAGSSRQSGAKQEPAKEEPSAIQYPQEEINVEDIPF
jgi:single-strand DNA-binding protein